MRIAYLVSQYPAPSHTFIRREVDELRRRGLDIKTYSIRRPLKQELISKQDRNEYHSTWYILPAPPALLVKAHLFSFIRQPARYLKTFKLAFQHRMPGFSLYPFFYFAEAIYLSEQLKRTQTTHLHNHFAQSGAIVGMLASQYLGIKWSFTVHGTSDFDGVAGALLNDKLKAASFVACVSYFGRAQIMRISDPVYWPKYFVSRCGVNLKSMPVISVTRNTTNETTRLLCVARLSPEKGITGLLEAFSDSLQKNSHMQLSIIGEGPERASIEQKITELDISNKCQLLGCASEERIFKELSSSDVFVLSSFMEGLPVVLMEALAVGVPVIAPCVAGIPELVEHNQSGLLFPPSNWEELSQCILLLCDNKQLRDKLAAEGQRRVRVEFDIREAVKPLLDEFNKL